MPLAFGLTITGTLQASASRRSGSATASSFASMPTSSSGRLVEIRLGQAGDGVGRARPKWGQAHPGDSGHGRRGLGHERGRGLVFGEDELEPRLSEPLDQIDDLSAGMPVDIPNARGAETIADRARDARWHAHRMPP